MRDTSHYAVGLDIGTTTVRCVVGHVDATTGSPSIVGVGETANTGMRKGTIVNLNGPAQAIDDALGEAERMSGHQVDAATVSVNGSHILSTVTDGMIAVGADDHVVGIDDIGRIEDVATVGKVPPNREILKVVPHSYRLDGQDNIKDPLGMTGTRLEVFANVISALTPNINTLHSVLDMAKVEPNDVVPSAIAAARSVLDEKQLENGVAVIDLGGSTTGISIFEEGDLRFTSVVPVGGNNITNDLAIGLRTDPEIAEKVKLTHGSATEQSGSENVTVKHDKSSLEFKRSEVDEIIGARLDELFEAVSKELKKAGRYAKLPSGVVLVGGGAKLKNIADYVKDSLGLAVKVGKPKGFGGVAENMDEPQYATAIGLMLSDVTSEKHDGGSRKKGHSAKSTAGHAGGIIKRFFGRLKT